MAYEVAGNLGADIAEELPFIGSLLGGGRLPISSAIPDFENLGKALAGTGTEDSEGWSGKKRHETALKEIGKPLTYLALPFGGGQLKKIIEGIQAVSQQGSYSLDSTGEQKLQYPVYTDTAGDFLGSLVGSTVFGKTSTEGGREWIDNGFQTMSVKATAAYKGMLELGIQDRKAYEMLDTLRNCKETDDVSKEQVQLQTLRDADFDQEGKFIIYYSMFAKENEEKPERSEKQMLEDLQEYGADMGAVAQAVLEIRTTKDDQEKWEACIAFSGDAKSQKRVLQVYMREDQYKKVDLSYRFGVDPDAYVEFLGLRKNFDENGNGSYSNKEITATLDSMTGLSKDEKAALWQISVSSTTKPESNPYSKRVGEDVLEVKRMLEEDEGK